MQSLGVMIVTRGAAEFFTSLQEDQTMRPKGTSILHELTCTVCGEPFMRPSHDVDRGRTKFCSRACADASKKGIPVHTGPQLPIEDRFMRHVIRTESCWLWTGATTKAGYGAFGLGKGQTTAHRAAWIIFKGPVADDIMVCHNCPSGDNPSCVNPDHLFLGTQAENMADMRAKGRQSVYSGQVTGAKNGNAKLTDDNVRTIRARRDAKESTYRQLAAEFGISRSLVGHIVARRAWKHVL